MNEANIEWHWQQYLKRVELDESTIPQFAKTELKRAFYGAVGQMLVFFMNDLQVKVDEKGFVIFMDMIRQVSEFYDREVKRDNAKNN